MQLYNQSAYSVFSLHKSTHDRIMSELRIPQVGHENPALLGTHAYVHT